MLKDLARQINTETSIFATLVDEHIHLQYDFGPEDDRSTFEFELAIEDDNSWTLYTEGFCVDLDSGKRAQNAIFKILDVVQEHCLSCY